MHFRFPIVDTFSFVLGLILASLGWWVYSILRPAFHQMRSSFQAKHAEKNDTTKKEAALEERYRQRVLLHAQGLHLAAPLFSLDEIIQPPMLLAPPPRVVPGAPPYNEDIFDTTFPYLPDWPELAAIYHCSGLTLSQALSGGSDIVLTGQPGMGKTVALAHLASRLARREPEQDLPIETVPFLFHIAELDLSRKKDEPLRTIIESIVENSPNKDVAHIPDFVRNIFTAGRALFLLDGTDELTRNDFIIAVEFIKAIKRLYPKTRIVVTSSSEFLDGLIALNFVHFSMAAWTTKQRGNFLEKWGNLWTNFVAVEVWAHPDIQVDPILLNGWLNPDNHHITPFELTLQTWAAYAGDVCGSRPSDAIETHLRRLSKGHVSLDALETLALQITMNAEPIFDPRKARGWVKAFEPSEISNNHEIIQNAKTKDSKYTQSPPSLGIINKLEESGLLTQHRKNRMRFVHPIFYGYLAGKSLSKYKSESIFDQPSWIGKNLALQYLAVFGDVHLLVEKLISTMDRPLSRNLLQPARWLRNAPQTMGWRSQVMGKLFELVREAGQPLGLRGQALCALIQSGDPSVSILFRQLLEEQDNDLIILAAFGCGSLRDNKAVDLLSIHLSNLSPNAQRAACLALVSIGTTAALDKVASALLHGDDNLRRAAAEALANNPGDGYSILKEGSELKGDILVRRAVVYGLGRISEPWAANIVNQLEREDEQWAVRTAATGVIEARGYLNPHIPQRLSPPTETPWIISFAAKQGLGVSPDKPPTDLLQMALKSGTEEERLASLAYLRTIPVEGVFGALYQAMYGGEPTLREAVFRTLSDIAARGVDLPDPVQFDLGY
jgi:HEAT repeat protein